MWELVYDANILALDSRIRDYVLFPILLVMFLQGILRHFIALAIRSEKKLPEIEKLQKGAVLVRAKTFRKTGVFLAPEAFKGRKRYFLEKALLVEEAPPVEEKKSEGKTEEIQAPNPEDLSGVMDMMKQSMLTIVPQMLSIGWVSYFFSGFVLIKLPFPLTDQFKAMLQRGINLTSLDPSYVSSLSWYFITLFGLRGLFSIVLGSDNAADDTRMLQQQAAAGGMMAPAGPGAMMMPGMKPDPNKPIKQEREELSMFAYKYAVAAAEYRLIGEDPPARLAQD